MKNFLLIFKRHLFLFLPLAFIPVIGNSNSVFAILILSIYVLYLFLSKSNFTSLNSKISTLLICFLFYLSVHSFILTDYTFINFIGSNTRNYGIFLYFVLFSLLLHFQTFSSNRISRVISLNLILVNILSLVGILQIFLPEIYGYIDRINYFDGKIFSTFMLPNFFGQYISISLGIALYKRLKNKRKYFFLLLIPGIALLLTRSKVAILALCLSIVYYLYEKNKHKIKLKNIIYLFSPIFLIFLFKGFFHLERSLNSRIEIFKSSIDLILQNPLGTNFYGLENLFPSVINSSHYFLEQNLDLVFDKSHNFFIDLLLVGGVPSLMFLAIFVSLLISVCKKDPKKVLLLIPIFTISQLSIFSVPSLVLITLIFAIVFEPQKTKLKPIFNKVIILLLTIVSLFYSANFYGQLQFKKYQENQNLRQLEHTLLFNPTNLKANLLLMQKIDDKKLDDFYIKSQNVFSKENLILKRAYFKAKILAGFNMEIQLQSLINKNPNDFKNHLLLSNYYYFKEDFQNANQSFNQMKKHIDISQIKSFKGAEKYLKAFKKFE